MVTHGHEGGEGRDGGGVVDGHGSVNLKYNKIVKGRRDRGVKRTASCLRSWGSVLR